MYRHRFVLEKGASYDPLKPNDQRWGVVRCVDALEHTVKLQWKAVSISNEDNFAGDKTEETLGDQAGKDNGKSVTDLKAEASLEDGNQVHCVDEFPDNPFLCCVGNVTGFEDGNMEVAPYEVFRIEKHEGSSVISIPHETNVDELPQEMIEHRSLPFDKKENDLLNSDGVRENCEKQFRECSSFFLPRAAFELFSSIKASIFQTLDLETCNQCTHSHQVDKLQFIEEITPNPEVVKTHEHNNSPFPFHNNNSNQFQQFDILKNCSDHHFFGDGSALTLSHVKRGWAKKVQQEWNILEKKLPERIDLMRAVIVGASGIPYHDGIFFFDICFPPEYPNEPPISWDITSSIRICFVSHLCILLTISMEEVSTRQGFFTVDTNVSRLEFPRDVVLDFFITSYLYSAYPKLKPGQLTDLRSFSVNNKPFACVAVDHRQHSRQHPRGHDQHSTSPPPPSSVSGFWPPTINTAVALVVFSSLGRLYEYANKRNPLEETAPIRVFGPWSTNFVEELA
ncbi:putative ubiquitin-conjugating enzyme E2 [Arachis hypogaea]|nr:putative ubiquitin-conjugating enzyme E2 [Arachis hypogaea]